MKKLIILLSLFGVTLYGAVGIVVDEDEGIVNVPNVASTAELATKVDVASGTATNLTLVQIDGASTNIVTLQSINDDLHISTAGDYYFVDTTRANAHTALNVYGNGVGPASIYVKDGSKASYKGGLTMFNGKLLLAPISQTSYPLPANQVTELAIESRGYEAPITLLAGSNEANRVRFEVDGTINAPAVSVVTSTLQTSGATSNYVTQVYSGGVLTFTEVYNGTTNTYNSLNN